jgi:hypothetical protein
MKGGLLEGPQLDPYFLGISTGIVLPRRRCGQIGALVPVQIRQHPSGHSAGIQGARKFVDPGVGRRKTQPASRQGEEKNPRSPGFCD